MTYTINKGINRSIEFRGLKAQYIWYFAMMITALLIAFAVLYIAGVPSMICVIVILGFGGVGCFKIFRLSHKYGEFGMLKKLAHQKTPKVLKSYNRQVFKFNMEH